MSAKPKFLYDNKLGAAAIASTTAAGFSALNLFDWRPYTLWKPTALPATVTMDCGSPKSVDFMLVHGEPGTYEVRGSSDNFVGVDVLLGTVTLAAKGLGCVFFTSVSYRYLRLRCTGASPYAVGIAVIGAALEAPVGLPTSGFDPVGRRVHSTFNRSEAGYPLGRIIDYEEWQQDITLNWLSWSWIRSTFEPAWNAHLNRNPFGFAWDYQDHPSETRLVMATSGFETPHKTSDYTDLILPVSGAM